MHGSLPTASRRQATLYLPRPFSVMVESIRERFNPEQFKLIRAHVTLCREDDVEDWEALAERARGLKEIAVAVEFDSPMRDGDFVYLPYIGSTAAFDELRSELLAKSLTQLRKQSPHITLVHPRNGQCSDNMFDEILSRSQPFTAYFEQLTLIEQINGGPWSDLATFGKNES